MNKTALERAERKFKSKVEAKSAMDDYHAEQEVVRARTARLRAERLRRDASTAVRKK